jgi:GDP-L-fucose synthase
MNKKSKIYIAGHNGMVGSAIWRNLESRGYDNLIGRSSSQLDLTNQLQVCKYFEQEKPEYVFLAASKVGGILANNTLRAEFIYDNLQIQNNVIHQSYLNSVKKLIFLASSSIYPKNSAQPIKEEYLLSGTLEETNEPYAVAKIAGMKLCENYNKQYGTNFISLVPTNLYGPRDNFDLKTSHVFPALVRKFHEAKVKNYNEVKIWGSGKPLREFMFVEDFVDATLHIMSNFNSEQLFKDGIFHINVGSGQEISIKELSFLMQSVIGFSGDISFDSTKPDGMMKKKLNLNRLKSIGWEPKTPIKEGLISTYNWYKNKMQ